MMGREVWTCGEKYSLERLEGSWGSCAAASCDQTDLVAYAQVFLFQISRMVRGLTPKRSDRGLLMPRMWRPRKRGSWCEAEGSL